MIDDRSADQVRSDAAAGALPPPPPPPAGGKLRPGAGGPIPGDEPGEGEQVPGSVLRVLLL